MPSNEPNDVEMAGLIGPRLFNIWDRLCDLIDTKYEMEHFWNDGGKSWKYEYKFRKGGKTLCALYAKENSLGFMVIFGKDERVKFETDKTAYSQDVQKLYDEAQTYHDGKWLMLELEDDSLLPDIEQLLLVKRKPNRKEQ